ncbi:Uncharacterised protein [Bordetella pertussis]|nr:Uncharacterised protein [Bordetella pertussis]CFN78980.1 Uncharacterised protein [Bordetella pertussis]CFN98780.1 Uncharacterised protein [Bordetella pertussis]CFO05561.1 Uncharacterised protein [Bordetella pertussis]CFO38755.1 Uncharacterised protein [Bordetella pertussis]
MGARQGGVARMHDALDDQLAAPGPADALHMAPVQVVARREIAQHVGRQDGRAARGERVLEMRHPVRQQGAQEGAGQPARAAQAVPSQPQARLERGGEARAHIVLAVGRDWNVHGQHQRPVAGARHALDQRVDAPGVAGQVGLEPGARRLARHFLERDERRSAHDGGDARRARRAGQHDVAAVGRQGADAHGGDAKGRGPFLAEELGARMTRRDVHQHARQESVFGEGAPVVVVCLVILGRARHVAENRPRQAAARAAEAADRGSAEDDMRAPETAAMARPQSSKPSCIDKANLL